MKSQYSTVTHGVLALALVLGGCIPTLPLRTFAPQAQTVHLTAPPDVAYQRAVRAFARFGGEVTSQDPGTRVLSGRVHNAVLLNVSVEPDPTGATVQVTGSVLPNKLTVGEFTEVQDYCALLAQER